MAIFHIFCRAWVRRKDGNDSKYFWPRSRRDLHINAANPSMVVKGHKQRTNTVCVFVAGTFSSHTKTGMRTTLSDDSKNDGATTLVAKGTVAWASLETVTNTLTRCAGRRAYSTPPRVAPDKEYALKTNRFLIIGVQLSETLLLDIANTTSDSRMKTYQHSAVFEHSPIDRRGVNAGESIFTIQIVLRKHGCALSWKCPAHKTRNSSLLQVGDAQVRRECSTPDALK